MESKWIEKDGRMIVELSGSFDGTSASGFDQEIEAKAGGLGAEMVWNFNGVKYVSSAGLRVILKTAKLMKSKGTAFVLCNIKDYVREVFDMAGLGSVLDIRNSCEDL